MPCCLTILRFGCGHKHLWKTHCSRHCGHDAICPIDQQEMMAYICYKWRCEDCLMREFDDEEALRTDAMDEAEMNITNNSALNEVQVEANLHCLRIREAWMDDRHLAQHSEKLEEVQETSEFAAAYGMAVWDVQYRDEEDGQAGKRHLEHLRRSKRWDVIIRHDAARDRAKISLEEKPASPDLGYHSETTVSKMGERPSPGILPAPRLDSERDAHAAPSA